MGSRKRLMSKGFKSWAAWLSLLALALCLAVVSSRWPVRSAPRQTLTTNHAPLTTAGVQMKDTKFAPAALNVEVGTTVVWTNFDQPSHNIAIDSGPELFVSPEQKQGQTARFTFTKPGSYHYFCEFHPFMQGTVVVTDPKGGAPTSSQTQARTYPETGKSVRGSFLDYWTTHGGLTQQGFPISEEMQERSDTDGKVYTAQYFERAVFEAHPENQPPYDLLLSLLGNFLYKQKYPNGAPGQQPNTSPGSVLFKETGKRLGGVFLSYWNTHGGLAQQGFPISDEFQEKSDLNGKTYRVQYFERAVFEYHPENKPPYDVLLSQLGTFRYKAKAPSSNPQTSGIYQVGMSSGPARYPLLAGPHAAPGVNVWIYEHDPAPVVGWVNDLGVKWVVHQLSWYWMEHERGVYNWNMLDRAVNALNQAGVKVILNPVQAPQWAWGPEGKLGYPNDPADFARFMTQVAQRYKGKVVGYQIWNEPDLARESGAYVVAARYAAILEAGYTA